MASMHLAAHSARSSPSSDSAFPAAATALDRILLAPGIMHSIGSWSLGFSGSKNP